ncbi:hypothetical protein [Mariprofundus erugo]|uniref:hypothetical protein n=1 Tax=Mariprofundus erugo TaxID=2528639 RepID=UPI001EE85049|nr:hypothetical protein [Mariprofundus erugo]
MLLLVSCSADETAWSPQPQPWEDLTIRVETRPVQPRLGMNEFLLIANHQQRGFINNLLVEVRTTESDWKQAMPDGALGVFRRALPVADLQHDQLFVRLTRDGRHGEMTFPLSVSGQ